MCIFKIILGAGMIIGGILVEIAWLGLCFGTVIVGFAMLIFSPGLLLIPFNIGVIGGIAVIASCENN